MARLLLGVSGGIAAYKALETARLAVKAGHAVRVIQTPTSERFVGGRRSRGSPARRCWSASSSPTRRAAPIPASRCPSARRSATWRWSSARTLYLIAPASANTIAKLAHGHADNLLTTAALAAACPVAVAPAMNNRMYLHPATQANLELLAERGVTVIAAGRGRARVARRARDRPAGRAGGAARPACEALLTARPTPGRGCACWSPPAAPASRSTASASSATAPRAGWGSRSPREAARRGAEVTLVAANVALEPPPGVRVVQVGTAAELGQRVRAGVRRCDVLLMAAAVADFRPAAPAEHKLKKDRRTRRRSSSSRPRTCSARWPAPRRAGPGARRVRGRARRGRGRATGAASSSARGSTRSSSTTSRRRASASTPPRTR